MKTVILDGQCLCGAVRYGLTTLPRRLYHCHCSLCRRQSGAAGNASILVHDRDFHWLAGQESIGSYVRPSGFRGDFCRTCGAVLPNPLRGRQYWWVPAGGLTNAPDLPVAAHLCAQDRAAWDHGPLSGQILDHLPDDLDGFIAMMMAD